MKICQTLGVFLFGFFWGSFSCCGSFWKPLPSTPTFPGFIFWAATFSTVWETPCFLGFSFSIDLCCFQQKERRFILRLMDRYNIGSFASSCGCDMSLWVVASKETDSARQEEDSVISHDMFLCTMGHVWGVRTPTQMAWACNPFMSSPRRAWGFQTISGAWIRQDFLFL